MKGHEAISLQEWLDAFGQAGGCVIRQIEKKKDIFALLKQWHAAFDGRHKRVSGEELPEASTLFLVSLFGDAQLPTHRRSSLTFALELKPPPLWVPDVRGIPGEFVLFDADLRWTVLVTHEETEFLFPG